MQVLWCANTFVRLLYASNIEHSQSTISSEALNQIGDESAVPSELSLFQTF